MTTQITVEEHNFDASNVIVTLKGESPAVESHEVEVVWTEAKDHRNETIADTYVATVTIPGDSIYTLKVEITDPAAHKDADEASFIVEMTDPTNLEITYSDDVWGQVLEAVTFGYYNAQMTVTISAEDATSGVAKICYDIDGDGEFADEVPDENGEISFTIDPEYRGKKHINRTNRSNNTGKCGNRKYYVDRI